MSETLAKTSAKHLSLEEMRAEVDRRRAASASLGGVACAVCPLAAMCAKKETAAAADCRDGDGPRGPSAEELQRRYREELDDKTKNLVIAQARRLSPPEAAKKDFVPVSAATAGREVEKEARRKFAKGKKETIGEEIADIAVGLFGLRTLQAARGKK